MKDFDNIVHSGERILKDYETSDYEDEEDDFDEEDEWDVLIVVLSSFQSKTNWFKPFFCHHYLITTRKIYKAILSDKNRKWQDKRKMHMKS